MADTHTEVLTAAGGVTGTFSQLVKGTGVVFTSTTINYDANSVWLDTTGLDITIAAAGDGIGYTPASMSAAVRTQGAFEQLNDRISTNSLAGVSNAFLQSAGLFQQAASIEAAQASLRSLSGQLHAASAAMTFRAIDAGNQALSDHLDNLRDGNAAFGMWTQQLGSGGGMARSGFDGVGFQMDGWLVGNDYRLGRSGVLGFAFGQGQGVQQLQAGADRDASRRTEGMVYAGLTSDRWYAQGRLGFGQFRQDVNRQLLLGNAAEGVWTRYGGRYQVAYGESGLRWNRGNVRIAPFVSMEYARSDRDAFAEEGAGGFGLRSDAQSQARWQAAVGLRAARQWNFGGGRSLDVGAHAQWFRTLGMDGEAMDASFVGLQQWSPLLGIGLSRHGSLAGVGLDARLSPRAMFKLGYDYERGQYDSAHGMTAALNVAF
jgi:fibronectin-binding autotransporter adhesin